MGEQNYGIDPAVATQIARDVKEIAWASRRPSSSAAATSSGVAASARGMDQATADYMGMLATIINALPCRARSSSRACPPGGHRD
jgi:uridylate kinase